MEPFFWKVIVAFAFLETRLLCLMTLLMEGSEELVIFHVPFIADFPLLIAVLAVADADQFVNTIWPSTVRYSRALT